MHRHLRAKETGRSEDWPQVHRSTAEVVFDKHGEPFDAEAAVRQWIEDMKTATAGMTAPRS